MSLSFLYRSPTTPAGPGWVEDLGVGPIRAAEVDLATAAEMGTSLGSQLHIDDPLGTVGHGGDAIRGLKQLSVSEDDAPVGKRRLYEGYIGERQYSRGRDSFRTGAARTISVDLGDLNAFLNFRVFQPTVLDATSDFDRPAETDVERIQALLAVDFLSNLHDGLVSTLNPVDMDANDYSQQRPLQVLNDCAQQSGKNFFLVYDEAGEFNDPGDLVLFYDFNASMVYLTDTRVSNVRADEDGSTTFYPSRDAVLVRDPMRVPAGIMLPYNGGITYRNRLATSYEFGYRDFVYPASNVNTLTIANARADRFLEEGATEDDRLSFSIEVPSEHVNDWREGQAGEVRFTHLPGYEDFRYVRALQRTVRQIKVGRYRIDYQATPLEQPVPAETLSFDDEEVTFDSDTLTFGS